MSSFSELLSWPEALPWLLLAPLWWLSLRTIDRARARRLARAVGPRVGALTPDLSPERRRLRRWLATLALALALIAIPQPRWGETTGRVEQRGVDLLVALDVSRSMLAQDLEPSRLARAKREIRALAERARGDRLGLVVFAGETRLAVPLTLDTDSFVELLELADPNQVRRGGTDLGSALEAALDALPGQSGEHEAVVLVTDGEDLEGRGLAVATLAVDRNVAVHCVGFGSALGSKIAVDAPGGGADEFLRDRAGREVVSAMDATSLRAIAEATGGSFVAAQSRSAPLVELYEKRVLPMARKAFSAEERRERENRFQWPLLLAFFLWWLELGLTDRSRR